MLDDTAASVPCGLVAAALARPADSRDLTIRLAGVDPTHGTSRTKPAPDQLLGSLEAAGRALPTWSDVRVGE